MRERTLSPNHILGKLIRIPIEGIFAEGNLSFLPGAKGLVIFSHGSGSSRFSPRNNFVAQQLQKKSMATFLVDLLTSEEDAVYANRFNIDLLTTRLIEITKWVAKVKEVKGLPIGYFGASTGAASALLAAAALPQMISAVVSRGGRPDLAYDALRKVKAPTLLIVGEADFDVLLLNQQAHDQLTCEKKLSVVDRATHLFEEPGALEEVSKLAGDWFVEHLFQKVSA